MNSKNLAVFGIPLLVIFIFILSSLFIVPQMQQALVLQFGELVRVIKEPGLKMKIPFVQETVFYDRRMLDLDVSAVEVTLGDQKRIVVDTYSRYRIIDPVLFYKTVRNETVAHARLSTVITGTLRSVLGHASLSQLLSQERIKIMHSIRQKVNQAVKNFGIEVVDVRIRRADLPKENSQAIFNRMISERQKEAQEIRAQGKEIAQVIRAKADLETTILLADAEKQAQILKGEGDATRADLYAEAYGLNPGFASLYQTLQAYLTVLADDQTTFILSPEGNDFLKPLLENPLRRAR